MAKLQISQADLSRLTGIHPSLISKLVRDHRRWNTDQIQSVCRALGVNPEKIFNGQFGTQEESYNDYRSDSIIDLHVLSEAIRQSELFLTNQKIRISPERKAKLILKLYEHWLVEHEAPDIELTRRYFQLV